MDKSPTPRHKHQIEDANLDPVVTLVANDNWLWVTLRYIVDYRKRRFVKDQVFTRILEEADKPGDRSVPRAATGRPFSMQKNRIEKAPGVR